ncbi:MAG: SGNH/GDSL hydrolase family protein [Syntrophales bacterium]|nr:SGNH/GDSL hydrolase family protein [Syntrophales bacterium]
MMRLLVRGGSIPAAYGVAKGYVDILKEKECGNRLDIVNRSRFRETSFDASRTFYTDILPFRPQILLLQFGVDDAFAGVYRSEFQENLVQVIRLARSLFDPIILLATAQTFDNPVTMEAVEIYYRSLRIIATDLHCHLIPVHLYWAGYLAENSLQTEDLTLGDERYLNQKGHFIMADVIGRWIDQVLLRYPESRNERPLFREYDPH